MLINFKIRAYYSKFSFLTSQRFKNFKHFLSLELVISMEEVSNSNGNGII